MRDLKTVKKELSMLDIKTYRKISNGDLKSFLFVIPKKNKHNSFSWTAQYIAKNKKEAIMKLIQDWDIDYDENKGHKCY